MRRVTPWLVLLALALRAPGLGTDFWLDEIWALNNVGAVGSVSGIFTGIHHDSNHWLMSLWMYAVGQDAAVWVYRLPSLLAGVGTVLLAGRLARQMGEDDRLAMLLVAVSFPLGFYASEARGYAMAACAGLGACWCLLRWIDLPGGSRLMAHWLVASLGLLAHLSFVIVLGAEAVFLVLLAATRRVPANRAWLPLLGPGLTLALLVSVDLRFLQFGGGPPLDVWRLMMDVGALAVGAPVDSSWTPLFALVAFAYLAFALARRAWTSAGGHAAGPAPDITRVFFAAVFLLPALGALALRPPFFFPRYFLVSLAFVPIVLSGALARPNGRSRVAVVLLFVLLNAWSWVEFGEVGRGHYAEAIADMTRLAAGPTTVSSDHDFRNSTIVEFYLRRDGSDGQKLAYTTGPGEFVIVSSRQATGPPSGCTRCALVGVYPSSPLSGSVWRVYRRPPGDDAPGEAPAGPSGGSLAERRGVKYRFQMSARR